jgi:acyl carrier protein
MTNYQRRQRINKEHQGTSMSTRDKVIAIVAEQAVLEVGDVREDSTLESLGIDSLGLVECIFAIEEEFDITIPFNANDPLGGEFDISSVAAIIRGIESLIADKA